MPTKVFISYSHDSEPHSQRVLALANQLREHGVDAELDQYVTRPSQGWPRWCEDQLRPESSELAARALTTAEYNRWILDTALDHLTLARATLYKAATDHPIPHFAFVHIAAAVDGVRMAGRIDHLPRVLLTRAWLQFLSGDEGGCRADLDEAWEIAERGPMPLFQADVQLYRARLFRDREALAEARRLIGKHGYHRRNEELADAELAAQGW